MRFPYPTPIHSPPHPPFSPVKSTLFNPHQASSTPINPPPFLSIVINTDDQYYNRYLMVVKVPVYGYDNMTGQGNQKASVAAILSPNGLGRSRLDSTYQDAVKATSN